MSDPSSRITLAAIDAFLAAADEGAVSAAARRLGASASGISQQITALEAGLGVPLLDRSARPLALTPAGHVFRKHAQAIVNELAAARAAVGLTGLSGLVNFRLGVIEDFEAELTPRLLSDLAAEFQGCQFLLETGPSHRLYEQLDNRSLDVVIATDTGAVGDWTETHVLMNDPFVAVLPAGRAGEAIGEGGIPDLPLILYTPRHYMGRLIAAHLSRQNLHLPHRFEMDSYRAILAMVAAGAGWTILTPLGVQHAHRFREAIAMRPMPFAPLARTITLTARRDVLRDMPARVAAQTRPLIRDLIVAPILADHPWLAGDLRVIGG